MGARSADREEVGIDTDKIYPIRLAPFPLHPDSTQYERIVVIIAFGHGTDYYGSFMQWMMDHIDPRAVLYFDLLQASRNGQGHGAVATHNRRNPYPHTGNLENIWVFWHNLDTWADYLNAEIKRAKFKRTTKITPKT